MHSGGKRSKLGQQRNNALQKSGIKDFSFLTAGSNKNAMESKASLNTHDKTAKPHKRMTSQIQVSNNLMKKWLINKLKTIIMSKKSRD